MKIPILIATGLFLLFLLSNSLIYLLGYENGLERAYNIYHPEVDRAIKALAFCKEGMVME